MSDTLEREEREKGIVTYHIHTILDTSPDTSFMGEYTDKPPEKYYFDLKTGDFVGDTVEVSKTMTIDEDADYGYSKFLDSLGITEDDVIDYWDEYNDDETKITYTVEYHKSLANVGSSWKGSRYYRYFVPPVENYIGNDDVLGEEEIKYCVQDYERMEGLNNGDWYFMGIEVTAYIDGEEVASASLWGIESDMDDASKEEIIDDLIYDCEKQLPVTAEKFESIAKKIKGEGQNDEE